MCVRSYSRSRSATRRAAGPAGASSSQRGISRILASSASSIHVGGESTIKSWGYFAWIDAHDGGCSLGGHLLVAEDDSGALSALVSGTAADDDPSGSIAEIEALYVLPGSARPRDRGSLLRHYSAAHS